MSDRKSSFTSGMNGPAVHAYPITGDDSQNLAERLRALYVGTAGDVTVSLSDDLVPVTFKNVPTGTLLPIRAVRVFATDTTATDLVGLV